MHYWGLRHFFDKPPFLIPTPHRRSCDATFVDDRSSATDMLKGCTWTTHRRVRAGWSIAIVLGMALAILMSQANWLERSLWPYLVALQAIPILAVVPIIGSIFGYETARPRSSCAS